MIRIEILSGQDAGRLVELEPGSHTLGRREGVDLLIQGDAVSGKHLELTISEDGTVHFRDLGSTNGTWSGGLKVEEGEWFRGTELQLGNLQLRLVSEDESPGESTTPATTSQQDSDAEIHRRAVREALQEKSRGGSWMMWVLFAVVLLAGGLYWFLNRPAAIEVDRSAGPRRVAAAQLDAIDDLGKFENAVSESWKLSKGLEMVGGQLRSDGGSRRAELLPRFETAPCRLRFEAQVEGNLQVWPLLTCGNSETEIAPSIWSGDSLANGAVELDLPCDSFEWFQLQLQIKGAGSLSNLSVSAVDGDGIALRKVGGSRKVIQAGANLALYGLGGLIFESHGAGGQWESDPKGLRFIPKESAWIRVSGKNPLVLTGLEPVGATTGLKVMGAKGLLFRGERPFWLSFEQPMDAAVGSDGIYLQPTKPLLLDWDFTFPLGEAARLESEIRRSSRQNDTARLLQVTQELLFNWPFNEEQVSLAESKRAELMTNGQKQLSILESSVAEAVFLASPEEMKRVLADVAQFVDGLPGTRVAEEATDMIQVLENEISQVLEDRQTELNAYNKRLLGGLMRSYPHLAQWLEVQE
ncbi:MAG: FHA domain-containing protein [Planctomycetota bacterium]|jgi:pSer/pThr/pTyr-binding forkhead associated (FHA) protein|nr:FHA domain-containing protein [Planctomycetota bacterium]MDP6941099.1 FHA domain-containing protein [Planctomycetota bacterium]